MLLMTMQRASNGVSSITRSITSGSLENKAGYWFLAMIKVRERIIPMRNEENTATTNENFAVLG